MKDRFDRSPESQRQRASTMDWLESGQIVRRQPAARHRVDEVVVDLGVKRKVLVKQWPREQRRFEIAVDIGPQRPLLLCMGEYIGGWLG